MNVQAAVYTNERGQDREQTPWPLPAGWTWVSLDDLGRWTGGGTPSKTVPSFWTDGTIPWVSPKDMKLDVIGRTEDLITEEALDRSATKLVPAGSVLMVMRSGILRHSFPVARTDRPVTLNQDLRALTPIDAVDPSYLARYLARSARAVLDACSKDGTTVNSIDARSLGRFRVPVPPLAEQRRIVARVDALFEEIAEGERALDAGRKGLQTYRRALLKSAVIGELTGEWRNTEASARTCEETSRSLLASIRAERGINAPAKARGKRAVAARALDTTTLPPLPEGWVWVTFRDVADVFGGLTKNPDREKMPEQARYLRVANVQAGSLDLSELKMIGVSTDDRRRAALEPGDLLIVEGNGSIDQIGRCALWNGEVADCVHQNHIIKVRFSDTTFLPRWCFTWLLSPHGRQEIEAVAASTSGLHTLSISKIEALPVPIPSPAEGIEILSRVAECLSAVNDTQHVLDAEASDVQRLRQSVIKAAFEGRLVPQDESDEPAAVMLARIAASQAETPRPRRGRPRAVAP